MLDLSPKSAYFGEGGKVFFYVEGPKTEKAREPTVVIRLVG